MVVRDMCQKKEMRVRVEFESQKRKKKMARCLGSTGRDQEDGARLGLRAEPGTKLCQVMLAPPSPRMTCWQNLDFLTALSLPTNRG